MSSALTVLQKEMRGCRMCLEAGYAITPGAVFQGTAGARVMLIGQAPGYTEVEAKRPFNAGSGQRLFAWLGAAGWAEQEFRRRHYMTSVTKCYPGRSANGKGDRVPSKAEQQLCRPYLEREMALVNPRVVIPGGGLAIKLFYAARLRLKDIIGTAAYIPPAVLAQGNKFTLLGAYRFLATFDPQRPENGRWVVPLPHPSGASLWPNRPENKALIQQAVELLAEMRAVWQL